VGNRKIIVSNQNSISIFNIPFEERWRFNEYVEYQHKKFKIIHDMGWWYGEYKKSEDKECPITISTQHATYSPEEALRNIIILVIKDRIWNGE